MHKEQLFQFTEERLSQTAIAYNDQLFTYSEVNKFRNQISESFKSLSFEAQNRIGFWIGNEPQFASAILAIYDLQLSAALFSLDLKIPELEKQISSLDLSHIVTTSKSSKLLQKAGFIKKKSIQVDSERLGSLEIWELKNTNEPQISKHEIFPEEFLLQFTSGTSSKSRVVSRSYESVEAEIENIWDTFQYNETDRIVCPVPLYHSYGLIPGLLTAMYGGSCFYLIETFIPRMCTDLIESKKATVFLGVPFMYSLLNRTFYETNPNLASLRFSFSGGAKLDAEVSGQFHEKFQLRINQLYGSTEAGCLTCNTLSGDTDPLSVGKPHKNTYIRIVDDEHQEVLKDEEGYVMIKTKANASGYLNEPALNDQLFNGGWLASGDIGRIDKDGNLYIVGRKNLFINVAGKKADPQEIEEVITSLEVVVEVAVIASTDHQSGEVPAAYVVTNSPIQQEEIFTYCRGVLADFKIPRIIHFIDELPRNAAGKVLKSQLKIMIENG